MIFLSMSIDYIEPVPVLSSCQRMLVVDVRTRSLYPPHDYLSIGSGLILVTLFTMDTRARHFHTRPEFTTPLVPGGHSSFKYTGEGEKGEKGDVESLKIFPLLLISEL